MGYRRTHALFSLPLCLSSSSYLLTYGYSSFIAVMIVMT